MARRYRPNWVAVEIGEAARAAGLSPERISRLTTLVLEPFERALAALTRIGRPVRDRAADASARELVITRALLDVATAVLARVPLRRAAVRELVVGAWQRLRATHQVTQERFCTALGLSPRTLRAWLARPASNPPPAAAAAAPVAPGPPRSRPPRRRRFGFDVTLPGTQIGADTTDLCAFGVPLKAIAAQDIGGRDQDLFASVLVDDHESAERVATVLGAVIADLPGAQVVTDQGTPYMAAAARAALEQLEAEHAPQKEGDPCGKSTVERAFETCKSILRPLLELTNQLAVAVPVLRDAALAKAATRLLLTSALRAYQAGARAARAAVEVRGAIEADALAEAASETRERARALDRSSRLLLGHVHELYGIARPRQTFVNGLRRYHPDVIHAAERAFRSQAHRDDIRDRASYFAAIVRVKHEEWRRELERQRRQRDQTQQLAQQEAEGDAQWTRWLADPAVWLRDALDALAAQWSPQTRELLFGGIGLGTAWLRGALARLVEQHGTSGAADLARGVLHAYRLANLDRLGPEALDAIAAVLQRELTERCPPPSAACPPTLRAAILEPSGKNRRPLPS